MQFSLSILSVLDQEIGKIINVNCAIDGDWQNYKAKVADVLDWLDAHELPSEPDEADTPETFLRSTVQDDLNYTSDGAFIPISWDMQFGLVPLPLQWQFKRW